jgi:hypothetical protein
MGSCAELKVVWMGPEVPWNSAMQGAAVSRAAGSMGSSVYNGEFELVRKVQVQHTWCLRMYCCIDLADQASSPASAAQSS